MRGEEGEGRKEGDTKQIGGREGEREEKPPEKLTQPSY